VKSGLTLTLEATGGVDAAAVLCITAGLLLRALIDVPTLLAVSLNVFVARRARPAHDLAAGKRASREWITPTMLDTAKVHVP
jgi:hypothetical protein